MSSLRSARARRRAARQRNIRIAAIVVSAIVLAILAFVIYSSIPKGNGNMVTTASGLQYEDLVVGSGETVIYGNTVRVHYTGWLENGTKFDSSVDRGQPFEFTIGAEMVIAGWDEGLQGMKVGGKRKLIIPPNLGYGAMGAGGVIPPNATLIFEVEVLEIVN